MPACKHCVFVGGYAAVVVKVCLTQKQLGFHPAKFASEQSSESYAVPAVSVGFVLAPRSLPAFVPKPLRCAHVSLCTDTVLSWSSCEGSSSPLCCSCGKRVLLILTCGCGDAE